MQLVLLLGLTTGAMAQNLYTTANAHSHNDYENRVPFYTAYARNFGSIEADIYLKNNELYVAHEATDIDSARTLENLYLRPIQQFRKDGANKRFRPLQLMIDLKTEGAPTLQKLVAVMQKYPALQENVTVTISGNQPDPATWEQYPAFIQFDGNPTGKYTPAQLARIPMMSMNFANLTKWNGKGVLTAADRQKVQYIIDTVHRQHKKIRFWGAPDNVNTWKILSNMEVDYIGTDKIDALADFLDLRPTAEYQEQAPAHVLYAPKYINNDKRSKVKNVILLIGDGMGLAQIHTGMTINHGQLNLLQMLNIGFSKTASSDSYITDSAAGGTAMATGKKTYNRAIGVDNTGTKLTAIPALIAPLRMKSGLISAGDITDATPAAFYAHQPERSTMDEIAADFLQSPVNVLMGSAPAHFNQRKDGRDLFAALQQKGYQTGTNLHAAVTGDKFVLLNDSAGLSMQKGRGTFLNEALAKTIKALSNPNGFFIMAEGAQIDYGGHANNIGYAATEMKDFDQLIGAAMQFADQNGETLVIVTADHETGGLSLLDGNFSKGYIDGHFSTNDHSGIMVPVFAYGPHSQDFRGVYENTEIFTKIMKVLNTYHTTK